MTYRKHYSAEEAAAYDEGKARHAHRDRREQSLVVRAMRHVPAGSPVLDLPCGAGRMTALWREHGYRVRAADVSPAMLERTRQRLHQAGHVVPCELQDLERLELADRSIDTLFCFRVFHHLPDQDLRDRVLGELCRVTRHRLLLSYLDARAWSSVRRRLLRRGPDRRHAQRPEEVARMLDRLGFRVIADLGEGSRLRALRLVVAERRPEGADSPSPGPGDPANPSPHPPGRP